MTAKTLVLPGEDPQKLQIRLETWTDQVQPQNDIEQYLLEQAVHASWKLDRAERVELARLSHLIETVPLAEARQEQEEAIALGFWLFSGRGKDAEPGLMENVLNVLGTAPPSAKGPGHLDFLDHPQAIVFRLESTAAGCQWLLERWAELRAELDRGLLWAHDQQVNAVRLLGKRPVDSNSCHATVDPFQWCANVERPDDLELERADRWDRWLLRQLDERLPLPEAETMAAFRAIAEREIVRLEVIAAHHRRRAEADDPAARLSFDPSPDGERLRRYQVACSRTLIRNLDTLLKVRRASVAATTGADDSTPEEPGQTPFAPDLDSESRETWPANSPADWGESRIEPIAPPPELEDPRNEATEPSVESPNGQIEPTMPPVVVNDHSRSRFLGALIPAILIGVLGGAALRVLDESAKPSRPENPLPRAVHASVFAEPGGDTRRNGVQWNGSAGPCRVPPPTRDDRVLQLPGFDNQNDASQRREPPSTHPGSARRV